MSTASVANCSEETGHPLGWSALSCCSTYSLKNYNCIKQKIKFELALHTHMFYTKRHFVNKFSFGILIYINVDLTGQCCLYEICISCCSFEASCIIVSRLYNFILFFLFAVKCDMSDNLILGNKHWASLVNCKWFPAMGVKLFQAISQLLLE